MNRAAMSFSLRHPVRLHPVSMPRLCLLIWFTFLGLVQSFAALAQTNVPTPLPPAAQEAVNKGILAAKVPDYPLAIRFFKDARKLAPDAPIVYLNLGLAESKIPGRELRAIAWFGAYLAALPGASNAAAVNEQIAALDVRNQSNVSRLLMTAQDAASHIPVSSPEHRFALLSMTTLWIDAGDIPSAMKAANLIQEVNFKSMALGRIADSQTWSGDLVDAEKTADLIRSSNSKSLALAYLAVAKFKAGDLTGARSMLASAQTIASRIHTEQGQGIQPQDYVEGNALATIAALRIEIGDIAGAKAMASRLKYPIHESSVHIALARVQFASGDTAGGQESLAMAQKAVDRIDDTRSKSIMQAGIAEVKAAVNARQPAVKPIQAGKATPAEARPAVTVADWLGKLDDDNKSNPCPLNSEVFLDLVAHLKSLPPDGTFVGVRNAAEKILQAQTIITGMLKQQAKR